MCEGRASVHCDYVYFLEEASSLWKCLYVYKKIGSKFSKIANN